MGKDDADKSPGQGCGASSELQVFTISAEKPESGYSQITCKGLDGNLPKTNGNTIALWDGQFPNFSGKPLKIVPMPTDHWPTRIQFPYEFAPSDYCLTYQCGADISTACAMARLNLFVNLAALPEPPENVSLKLQSVSASAVTARYTTLSGYMPRKNGNWAALYNGYANPYSLPAPLSSVKVGNNQSPGTIEFNNLSLVSGTVYSLIYFMAGGPHGTKFPAPAAMVYFTL